MTPKQVERVKNKIKKIKAVLSADKKYWGGHYHDGQGLRYIPPQLYIQIDDFSGGLRYFNWFDKNFSDDSCYPDFLYEWTIILFKTGRLKEAEKKAFQLFCSDKVLFNKIVGQDNSTISDEEFVGSYINELKNKESLSEFKTWLNKLVTTEKFILLCNKYVDIKKRLKTEQDEETEEYLRKQLEQLENGL
jgi:hypothetical protein